MTAFASCSPRSCRSRKGPLGDLAAVMHWVSDRFAYDHHDASLRADAARMLDKQRGHCSDYHGFCAAMGRALGYPTRVTYGINPFPKNSPSHCKLEAFLPPYGWVSFDVSETQRLVAQIRKDGKLAAADKERLAAAATDRLTRGFRDNTWFCLTRGTDYDLAPPASRQRARRPHGLRRGRRRAAARARPGRSREARVRLDDRPQVHARPRSGVSVQGFENPDDPRP